MHELANDADSAAPASARPVVHEVSAGGVVLRHIRGAWQVALIEPNIINADTVTRRAKARPEGTVFALPKGGVDEGETPEQSADREVFEETGVRGTRLFRLTTIRYVYIRSWGGREQVSKAVSFYLFLYASGRLGQIRADMRDEVRKAFWFPLDKAHRKLTYRGEREVLKLAQKIVREQPELLTPPPPNGFVSGSGGERPVARQRESASSRLQSSGRGAQGQGTSARGGQPSREKGSERASEDRRTPRGGQPASGDNPQPSRQRRRRRRNRRAQGTAAPAPRPAQESQPSAAPSQPATGKTTEERTRRPRRRRRRRSGAQRPPQTPPNVAS